MTSKDQERKALEQIRKIVAALGEESYIGKAFEGCLEIASDNIDNNFWNTYKDTIAGLRKTIDDKRNELFMVDEELNEMRKRAEFAESQFNMTQKTADNWCAKYHEAADSAKENWNKFREQEDKVEALELELVKLKAKLYDMMVGA
jgi:chromosome segregation ATPase